MFENANKEKESDSSVELDEEIKKKNLTGKQHMIEFIGIKPKVNTNRPLTKE